MPPAKAPVGQEWMTTYGDMVTLLLCFFVIIAAMSVIDPVKLKQISDPLADKPVVDEPLLSLDDILRIVNTIRAEQGIMEVTDAGKQPDGVWLKVLGDASFAPARAELRPLLKDVLDAVAQAIQQPNFPLKHVSVEGHTDPDPISTAQFPTNWHLSVSRSSEVVNYLVEQGVDARGLSAVGFAATQPDTIAHRRLVELHPEIAQDERELRMRQKALDRRVILRFSRF